MPLTPSTGDVVYAGYPSAFVRNFSRNTKKKLTFGIVKHLLWGDWIKVTDYDYATDPDAEGDLTDEEKDEIKERTEGMIPVRCRGQSGYMDPEDLQADALLEIVFLDVGQGDGALMITPDNKRYVIDAGKGDNMYRYLKWRFSDFDNSQHDFDALIITHPDNDHYLGFSDLVEDKEVQAGAIYHNGLMEQFSVNGTKQSGSESVRLGRRVEVRKQDFLTDLIQTDKNLRDFLADEEKRRWVSDSSNRPKQYPELLDKAVRGRRAGSTARRFPKIEMLSTRHGEIVDGKSYLPGFGPDNAKGCTIQVIGPIVEDADGGPALRTFTDKPRQTTTSMNAGKTKNGHSVLLKLNYGAVNLLFGGDLNSSAEMFLLSHYTGLDVYDAGEVSAADIIAAGRPIFQSDVAKACHHGSADFTDSFLGCINAAATVISSGDEESHAHPRSDTLGAIGHHGRGHRSLIFSTELARSTREYTDIDDIPAVKAEKLRSEAEREDDADKKAALLEEADRLDDQTRTRNVTVYGAINLRADKDKIVLAYMLEKPSKSRRWDIYTLESTNGGPLAYLPVKEAEKREEKRREDG
ncbi:MAG: hypothetical protein AAF439_06730 [Pseudomonadota bacterium]